MTDPILDRPPIGKVLIAVAVAVLLAAAGGGGWWYWNRRTVPLPSLSAPEPDLAPAPPPEERIQHPVAVPPSGPATAPLPDLNDSDRPVADALGSAAAGLPIAQYLLPENIVRHFVVTIDNLPRQKVAVDKRPVGPTAGQFIADGDELHATLDRGNFARYRPLVDMLGKADLQKLATVYLHFYPLFQKAYQDLGYPTGYFNDRLVTVIDLLIATPQVSGPIELQRPNVMYTFVDPALEGLPAGQKVLIRMGPDNAAIVKAKLTELRAILTGAAPKQ